MRSTAAAVGGGGGREEEKMGVDWGAQSDLMAQRGKLRREAKGRRQ